VPKAIGLSTVEYLVSLRTCRFATTTETAEYTNNPLFPKKNIVTKIVKKHTINVDRLSNSAMFGGTSNYCCQKFFVYFIAYLYNAPARGSWGWSGYNTRYFNVFLR
jgi:hypothetical protein